MMCRDKYLLKRDWNVPLFGDSPGQRFFQRLRRDVGHEGEILDQTASFTFWGVRGAEHSPLTRLQRTRSTDLSGFFELRVNSRHHA
jgi:hypothetical protein